ncbi:LysR family transcriptional regulator [Paracidovorax valerianellae]|uniref:Transcriptional regulator, LysR family n=1 Tax=Paracidovorax valerianellae TaxID=187868 RepID=A0A1G6PL44_9BURK|nr:LysR family transcriptional regulator [Paracidovorax valerianellae]MDA8444914.1 LysR family transcriptional regulator [Paracidovorax valerianellae]SDC80930.1 transcriptional regulator, LysR family [Paracidovorax valerianellae]
MDRLLTMRVFQAVVDEGGFAAAARAMDLSAAAVTRLIADLESHIGARLLQRTTRRVSLTDAGEAYLARVRTILADVEEAFAAAQAHTSEIAGVLRLHAPPMLAVHILAPLVEGFHRAHPRVVLDIHVDSSMEPPIGSFDITLLSDDAVLGANVVTRPIVRSDSVVCASPAYLQRHGMPQSPEDLVRHQCLLRRRSDTKSGVMRLFDPRQAEKEKAVDIEVQPVCVANHIDTLLRAALDGAGLTSLPVDLAAPYLRSGQLVRVLAPWTEGRFTLYAAFPSRKFMPARTRVFLDFMSAHTKQSVEEALQAPSAMAQAQET